MGVLAGYTRRMDDHLHADFVVSTDGDDRGPGSGDRPFATIERARLAVRDLRSSQPDRDIVVVIRGGTYHLGSTLVLRREDGASGEALTRYVAHPGERPVLSGGVPVTGWQKVDVEPEHLHPSARGRLWVAPAPPAVQAAGTLTGLFHGARRLQRARSEAFPVRGTPGTRESAQTAARDRMEFDAGTIRNWPDIASVELAVIPQYTWTLNILPVREVDETRSIVWTSFPHTYPMVPNAPVKGPVPPATFSVENTLAYLSSPGEWTHDREAGLIYYWPHGVEPEPGLVAAHLTELVRVEGDVDYEGRDDQPVRGISFEGLTFTHGARYPWHGATGWGIQHDWESFDRPTALLRFRGAERCAVRGCRFVHSNGAGVRLDLHCRRIDVTGNLIADMGGCGVLLCGYGPGTKDVNRHNRVENNHIHHVGVITWHAPAIFAWQSGWNLIRHNHLHHTPYTAVVVSGRIRWDRDGYAECSRTVRWHETSAVVGDRYEQPLWFDAWYPDWKRRELLYHGRNNEIAFNDIHDVMERMGDGNGIYISGTGGGNHVYRNCIHDCPSSSMYEAIRCDDDQHETIIEENLIYRLAGAAIGIAVKGLNDIVGNVVAHPLSEATHRAMISLEMGRLYGVRAQRNLVYATRVGQALWYQGEPLHGDGPLTQLRDCHADLNLYWCEEDPQRCRDHLERERAYGIELHSVAVDPLFRDPQSGDYRFTPGSAAEGLGIPGLTRAATGTTAEYPAELDEE